MPKVSRKPRRSAQTPDEARVLTGPDLIDEMVKHTTLDEYFDRMGEQNPDTLTDDDLREILGISRRERAAWISKGDK